MNTQNIYEPIICNDPDLFEQNVKAGIAVIEIEDTIKNSFLEPAKAAHKERQKDVNMATGVAIPETAIIGVIMSATIPEVLFAGGVAIALARKVLLSSAFSHYELAIFDDGNSIRMLAINRDKFRKDVNRVVGLEEYRFIFSNKNDCPVCGKTQKGIKVIREKGYNPYSCIHCGQKYIWTVNLKKYLKESMHSETEQQREYERYGIPSNYSASNGGQLSSLIETEEYAFEEDTSSCKSFRESLMSNKFADKQYFSEEDGKIFSLEKAFLSAEYGTPEAEIHMMNLMKFINTRSRQIRGKSLDWGERKQAKYVLQSFELGAPVKIGSTYENVLKEVAWSIVMTYLCGIFLALENIDTLIPKDKMLFSKWNSYVNGIQYAPQNIRDLFIINEKGLCKYIERHS